MCSPFPATRARPSLANTIWTIPFSSDEEMWLFHFRGRQTLMPQHPNNGFHFSRNNYEGSRTKTAQWWYVLFSNYVNWQEQKGLITVGDLFLCLVEGPILNALCFCSWCFEQLLLSISDGQGQLEGQSHFQMISSPPQSCPICCSLFTLSPHFQFLSLTSVPNSLLNSSWNPSRPEPMKKKKKKKKEPGHNPAMVPEASEIEALMMALHNAGSAGVMVTMMMMIIQEGGARVPSSQMKADGLRRKWSQSRC